MSLKIAVRFYERKKKKRRIVLVGRDSSRDTFIYENTGLRDLYSLIRKERNAKRIIIHMSSALPYCEVARFANALRRAQSVREVAVVPSVEVLTPIRNALIEREVERYRAILVVKSLIRTRMPLGPSLVIGALAFGFDFVYIRNIFWKHRV